MGTEFSKRSENMIDTGPENESDLSFGVANVDARHFEFDHHGLQYESSRLIAMYHHWVLKNAAAMARLSAGMCVLDYGCSGQQLRRTLPHGVHYVGYDIREEVSDIRDPSECSYDVVFAVQVLYYLNLEGLRQVVDLFANITEMVIVMCPRRNFVKDQILDRLFGLNENREQLNRTTPDEIYSELGHKFDCSQRKNLFWMGELTRWIRLK